MSTDFLLREQFVTDPAQIASEYIYSKRIPAQQASVVNHLLFAVISNPALLGWLRSYSRHHRNQLPSVNRFLADFSRAVTKYDGSHVVTALFRGFIDQDSTFVLDEVLLHVLLNILVAGRGSVSSAGTEMSTGTDFGTERSGTEVSQERRRIFSEGTEMSTGTDFGTERSGTEVSQESTDTSYVTVILEALAQYAVQLRRAGALDMISSE